MKEPLKKRTFQFEENPKIEDIIITLQQAECLGYTRIKPFVIDGDYKHETMDCEKVLVVHLF